MLPQQLRIQRSRFAITAFLCIMAHLITKAWIGGFSKTNDNEIIYPEDPRYVAPEPKTSEPRESKEPTNYFLNFTDYTPKIVWLMSFPNSGTSYTMTNIKKITNRSVATNYADEVTLKGQSSLPVYPFHDEGPFWPGTVPNKMVARPKELPDKYILTKTHCGSRCLHCGPKTYVEDVHNFTKACASGHGRIPDPSSNNRVKPPVNRVAVDYPPERVSKAIHLIRNPYNNLVARFHLARRGEEGKKHSEFLEKYPNDAKGFQGWCADLDAVYADEDKEVFTDKELLETVTNVTCHGEFYLYVQWHNLAFETEELLKLPTYIVHYEEYEQSFDSTVARMLEFLEAPAEGEPHDFSAGHAYDDYFSKEQRQAVKKLVTKIASPKTLLEVERYL